MTVLGISCFYHDAAAAIVRDGQLVAAAQEERFSRVRHDPSFPRHAIAYCLREAGIDMASVDYVGFYDRPLLKFERILETAVGTFPRGLPSFLKAMPVWLKEKLWIPQIVRETLQYEGPILYADHHLSHAASAFLVSPFERAAILTVDGVGEWDTTTFGVGEANNVELLASIEFPHSLGLLYSAFTYYLGFRVNSAEYKVMGLAPYGKPLYTDRIRDEIIEARDDGSFRLNLRYFEYPYGLRMTNRRFDRLWGQPARKSDEPVTQFHKDMAASLQEVTNDVMVRMASHVRHTTGMKDLCLAGGVALNCVANERILRDAGFERVFIQPAAGDAGGAVGIAFHVATTILGSPRTFRQEHASWGPAFTDDEVRRYLDGVGASYRTLDESSIITETVEAIERQQVVGWFQGRMEWGPRALGNRSILADARNPQNWSRVNLKIKFRESFRPFAPSVPEEDAGEYFDLPVPSPFMLLTAPVRPDRRTIPAVTHVDGSARIQTVSERDNSVYYRLLRELGRRTGCPVVINTSFNVRGEPIVCTPHDALQCFLRTDMDVLVLGRQILTKQDVVNVAPAVRESRVFEAD